MIGQSVGGSRVPWRAPGRHRPIFICFHRRRETVRALGGGVPAGWTSDDRAIFICLGNLCKILYPLIVRNNWQGTVCNVNTTKFILKSPGHPWGRRYPKSQRCQTDTGQNRACISIFVVDAEPFLAWLLFYTSGCYRANAGSWQTGNGPALGRCLHLGKLLPARFWLNAGILLCLDGWWLYMMPVWYQNDVGHSDTSINRHQPVSDQNLNVYRICTWISLGPV